jgi:hypothetical protein
MNRRNVLFAVAGSWLTRCRNPAQQTGDLPRSDARAEPLTLDFRDGGTPLLIASESASREALSGLLYKLRHGGFTRIELRSAETNVGALILTKALSRSYQSCVERQECGGPSLDLVATARGFGIGASPPIQALGGQPTKLIPPLADGTPDWDHLRATLGEIRAVWPDEEISVTADGPGGSIGPLCHVVAVASDYFSEIRPY